METIYFLKYPQQNPGNSVVWNIDKAGKFVAVDYNSGGYPYPVENLVHAQTYKTPEEAIDYHLSFPWLEVWEGRVEMKPSDVKIPLTKTN